MVNNSTDSSNRTRLTEEQKRKLYESFSFMSGEIDEPRTPWQKFKDRLLGW